MEFYCSKIEELNKQIDIKKQDEAKLKEDINNIEAEKIKEVGSKLIEIAKKDEVINKKEEKVKELEKTIRPSLSLYYRFLI